MITAKTAKKQDIPLRTAAAKIRIGAGMGEIAEIRLRAGRRAAAVTTDGRIFPCSEPFSAGDIAECFQELCRYSVHSFSREISEGYITLEGGHRVGICGTSVCTSGVSGRTETFRDISSLCIRMAREVRGCAEPLYEAAFSDGLCSLLVLGKPMSGKTTVLRDLARLLGENHRVVLIDSRNELSASLHGQPALDIGENTDALVGCGKSEGIMLALRSLSPEIIVCDEIGDDFDAVRQCLFCGVKLVAAAHAGSFDEARRREGLRELLPCFDKTALLGTRGALCGIERTFSQPLCGGAT